MAKEEEFLCVQWGGYQEDTEVASMFLVVTSAGHVAPWSKVSRSDLEQLQAAIKAEGWQVINEFTTRETFSKPRGLCGLHTQWLKRRAREGGQ